MLRPVSAFESLPDDVEGLTNSLRSNAPSPMIGVDVPVGGRASPRKARRPSRLEEIEELDDLEALDELLDSPGGTLRARVDVPGQTAASMLENWTVRAQVYSTEVASKLSILAGLFGVSGTRATAGAMHEAKRFRLERTPEINRWCEVGVAVRLIVATTEWKVDAEVSVPNLAAAAQLNWDVGDARIGIEVAGYSGPLGALLPAPPAT